MTDPGTPRPLSPGGSGDGNHGAAATAGARAADAAVTGMYAENSPHLLAYLTGLLHDHYLAEDVLQETMLCAWRHCAHLSKEKGSVRAWLLKVAHNLAVDKIRIRRSQPVEIADIAAPEPGGGDHADAVVNAVHIRQALARLSPGHRGVLEQLYINGLTVGKAAAVLGIPEGTVSSRAHFGLRKLRRELDAPPVDPGITGAFPCPPGSPRRRAAPPQRADPDGLRRPARPPNLPA